MKIIIIRHGDPIYGPNESLTEHGFAEVKALSDMYKDMPFTEAFTSPLPRALLTKEAVLGPSGRDATVCPWLVEFYYPVKSDRFAPDQISWDLMPSFFENEKDLHDNDKYLDVPMMRDSEIKGKCLEVWTELDKILERHGYTRNGALYSTKKGNDDVLVFFCHFGTMCVLMSHLLNIPYPVLGQHFCCPPSGVTTIYSEEREEGIVHFRCQSFGDISHLKKAGLEPEFAARFCEKFDSKDRH